MNTSSEVRQMPKLRLLGVLLCSVGLAVAACWAETIPSHLGNQGPRYEPGTTPSKLGWGPDDQAYADRFVVNPQDGAEMIWVPAGEFTMGGPSNGSIVSGQENPEHKVMLSAFWMDNTEVTNEQYGKFLAWIRKTGDHSKCFKGKWATKDHTPSLWRDAKWNGPKQPVVGVNWYDAYAYAAWAGKRLPTEAQWEKAARGTDGREYPWGNQWEAGKRDSSGSRKGVTADVGSCPEGVSPYGCLDMAGSLWEWCADRYRPMPYQSSPLRNPVGPASGSERVRRGGSWANDQSDCRSTLRNRAVPGYRSRYSGFRCATTP